MYDKPWYRRSKFWMGIVAGLIVVLNEGLGLGIDSEAILATVAPIVAYILAQGYVDGREV